MKVGLLTVHCSNNAGASLQAYALYSFLKKGGYYVEIINYRPFYFVDDLDRASFNKRHDLKSRILNFVFKRKKRIDHKIYIDFEKRYLNVTMPRINDFDEFKKQHFDYDIIVCGSDQIWNPVHVKNDQTMFLNIETNAIKASYAASIGQDKLNDSDLAFLGSMIKGMDYISVREESAKKLLEALAPNRIIQRHVDPTFLLTKNEWLEFESNAYLKIKGDYVLFYPLAENPISEYILKEIKKRFGIKIVALSKKVFKQKNVDVQIRHFSPNDFVSYIHHSSGVITNSFHGTVFSLIFGKKLFSYKNLERNSRIEDLFKLFGIKTKQICCSNDFVFSSLEDVPSVKIDECVLQKEVLKATNYLHFGIKERGKKSNDTY